MLACLLGAGMSAAVALNARIDELNADHLGMALCGRDALQLLYVCGGCKHHLLPLSSAVANRSAAPTNGITQIAAKMISSICSEFIFMMGTPLASNVSTILFVAVRVHHANHGELTEQSFFEDASSELAFWNPFQGRHGDDCFFERFRNKHVKAAVI